MIKRVIGIDPGTNTRYAEYDGGLRAFKTNFWGAVDLVSAYPPKETAVIVELPRSKHVWHGKAQNNTAMARTGVNVGSVIREAELLADRFNTTGYTVITVHPRGKTTAAEVKHITGYEGRTNEHTRDAIMLAWIHKHLLNQELEKCQR